MNKLFTFLCVLLTPVSCNTENSKTSVSNEGKTKIENAFKTLELKLEKEHLKYDSLNGVVIKRDYAIDSIKEVNNKLSIFLAKSSLSFLRNKSSMVAYGLKYLNLKSNNVLSAIWNHGFIYTCNYR